VNYLKQRLSADQLGQKTAQDVEIGLVAQNLLDGVIE
jgi:hypothetical protein